MGPKEMLGDKELVPADFGKKDEAILVMETTMPKMNRELDEAFKKYYKGEYRMVPLKDRTAFDNTKYRLSFHTNLQNYSGSGVGNSRTSAGVHYSFYVIDRSAGKTYGPTNQDDIYDVLLKAYVKKLEEVRSGNKK